LEHKKYRLIVSALAAFSISIVMGLIYVYLPGTYHTLDDNLRDFAFVFRGAEPHSEEIVIVDIDEKSLSALGQWPWERKTVAALIDNLTAAQSAMIGLDILFAEPDRSSPRRIAKLLGVEEERLEDYDQILGESVANSPTVLGYLFDFEHKRGAEAPQIPAIFVEKGYQGDEFLFCPPGVLKNIPPIQDNGYSSGFLNNVPDLSGMIRSVPLVMKYEETLYPSLALEMMRIAHSARSVLVRYNETGVEKILMGDLTIPVDRFGRLYVNFRGPAKSYRYLSASDVVANRFDPADVEGKIVLVGTSAYGLMDLRSTPLDNVMPGVEVHANVIDNILSNDMLYKPDWAEGADLVIICAISAIVLLAIAYLPFILGNLMIAVLGGAILYGNYLLLFHYHVILNIFFPLMTFGISVLAMIAIKYVFEARQKKMIKKKFSQKVSSQVMEDLILQGENDFLATRDVNVTIFFSDIRSFTTISEQIGSSTRLVEFLNYYMTRMAHSIVTREGTIDKFIGDAIMAYWNAPNHVDHHADKGVEAALEQITMREELNKEIRQKYGFELDFGIGINTGDVTVGDIGSIGRSDYTIIGDPVNLASRLEGLCKYYGVRLIISEFTQAQLTKNYVFRDLDWVKVKGKHEPVKIYEVISNTPIDTEKEAELQRYHEALRAFRAADIEYALEIFEQLYQLHGGKLYQLYVDRSRHLIDNKIVDFNGVFEFDFK
jgi:adenylate cyclase